ncbi:MAG: SET domain-containing protein-lysine N-methyltransferase [Bryobacterales bacterium]|nr:SET domain-containing protein-lysine N-methyltransferase [Bryobacterales bacterium]
MADPALLLEQTPRLDPRHTPFQLRIARSGIHRWGVFAGEFIPKGRKIIEYTGERISRRETKKRAEREFNYLFTLDAYWTIDGSVGGSGAEYINHCCEPNCYSYITNGHILYMARQDIHPGEELTIDYRFEPNVERTPCHCGAPACRGTINRLKEKPPSRRKAG